MSCRVCNREGAKKCWKKVGLLPATGNTGKRRSLSPLVPMSLTTQVGDQWNSTGLRPVCSPTQNHQPILPVFTCSYTPPGRDLYCSPCRLYEPTYRSSPHIPLEEVMWQAGGGGLFR